jgi:hypothetical protein
MRLDAESQMGLMISRYLDNETSPVEKELVEKHLSACGSCRDTVAIFRKNDDLLKSALNVEIYGNQIVERVTKRLEPETRPRPLAKVGDWLKRPAAWGGAAAVALGALAAVALIQNSALTEMKDRIDGLGSKIAREESMRQEIIRISQQRMDELAREQIVDRFDQDPRPGILAAASSGQVHLSIKLGAASIEKYQIYRREEGQADWGTPLATTIHRRYSDVSVQGGKTYEYRVAALDSAGLAVRDATVKVAASDEFAAIVQNPGLVRIGFLALEGPIATVSVQRTIGGHARTQIYRIQIGQEVGSRVPDLMGTQTLDLRTGCYLSAIIDEDQTLGVTSHGDHFTRPNKKLVLRPLGSKTGAGYECWLGGEVVLTLK